MTATGGDEHAIEDAYYSNLPGPEQMRCLACSCGFTALGSTWEQAGWGMDRHLEEVA